MPSFTPLGHGSSTSVAATDSAVGGTITCPAGTNALHIANTSATLYVSCRWGVGAQTGVTLGDSFTLPPKGHRIVDVNGNTVTHVAAIGSAAGPTAVVFTPGRSM